MTNILIQYEKGTCLPLHYSMDPIKNADRSYQISQQ